MIKLRLKRFGKKREASFRLVACNSTSRRDGRPLQELGFYNPRTKETRLDTEAIRERLGQGAQPTDVVRTLLERGGLIEKTIRPAETVGKAKQAAKLEEEAKQAAKDAAEALRITSAHMKELGVIDAIVPEPLGGAHRDQATAIASLGDTCFTQLQQMQSIDAAALVEDRAQKYLAMGDGET